MEGGGKEDRKEGVWVYGAKAYLPGEKTTCECGPYSRADTVLGVKGSILGTNQSCCCFKSRKEKYIRTHIRLRDVLGGTCCYYRLILASSF